MKSKLKTVWALLLCLLLLPACAENTPNDPPVPPPQEPSSTDSPVDPQDHGQPISDEAIEIYTDHFGQNAFNGLLRFPYTDGADADQIAPYLELLFYDMGETDLSEEEYTLLEKAGMILEVDEFRLSRSYVEEYLICNLDMPRESAERIVRDSFPGTYLPETDAWYICHGDTSWMRYTFDKGEYFPNNETVKLHYVNPFLAVIQPGGEMEFLVDQAMVVTISIEGGEIRVLSNVIAD